MKVIPAGTASLLAIALLAEQQYFVAKINKAAEKVHQIISLVRDETKLMLESIEKAQKQLEYAVKNISEVKKRAEGLALKVEAIIGVTKS